MMLLPGTSWVSEEHTGLGNRAQLFMPHGLENINKNKYF